MYRTIVVGRGLIGSAAARHLAEKTDGVACIGPDEPTDRSSHSGVFASHYDEGRMTRVVDPTPDWSITAKRSIERYQDLETRSGVAFFTPAGYLGVGGPGSDYNDRCDRSGKSHGASLERLSAVALRTRFPFLSVPDDTDGLLETGSAGHISPRAMVKAQTVLAERAGASLVPEAATAVRPTTGGIEIELSNGTTVAGERALVATGGFTSACGLSPVDLKLVVFGRTAVLVRIDEPVMSALSGMPTMIHCETGAYILPPILYPDGHHYLKIGIGTDDDIRLSSLADLQKWFKSDGSGQNLHDFRAFLTSLIPALAKCESWHTDTCVVTQTASGLPIVDFVFEDRIAVAVGGNGKGAKGADEWGRIAARLIEGEAWDGPVERARLALPQGRP